MTKKNIKVNKITYGEAIREALQIAMSIDESVICYGLGVDDPKGIFGTRFKLSFTQRKVSLPRSIKNESE